jgi:uncharacterized membrane protein HdeD (DUF308 family)
MSNALSRDSWLLIIRGIVAIALGVLAFVYPGPTLAALIYVFAFYAIFDGVLALMGGFAGNNRPNWWLVAAGIAAIAVGTFTFFQPGTTAVALVLLVGIFAIVTGVGELVAAVTLGQLIPYRWLLTLSGIVGVVFGVFLIMSPGDGILSVLWLIGIYAIFAGILYIGLGITVHQAADTVKSVEPEGRTAAV